MSSDAQTAPGDLISEIQDLRHSLLHTLVPGLMVACLLWFWLALFHGATPTHLMPIVILLVTVALSGGVFRWWFAPASVVLLLGVALAIRAAVAAFPSPASAAFGVLVVILANGPLAALHGPSRACGQSGSRSLSPT